VCRAVLARSCLSSLRISLTVDLIQFGNVDLCPSYQRDVVWTEPKMVALIQSLFLNYYVPPVIFAVEHKVVSDVEDEVRTCIDGKQRCTSIQMFIEGKIPFISPATKEKFWYTKFSTGQRGGRALPGALKRKFDNISIQVVEYDGISIDLQRDIFRELLLFLFVLRIADKKQSVSSLVWRSPLPRSCRPTVAPGAHGLPSSRRSTSALLELSAAFWRSLTLDAVGHSRCLPRLS